GAGRAARRAVGHPAVVPPLRRHVTRPGPQGTGLGANHPSPVPWGPGLRDPPRMPPADPPHTLVPPSPPPGPPAPALVRLPGPAGGPTVRLGGPAAVRTAPAGFSAADPVLPSRRRWHAGAVRLPGVAAPLPADLHVWPAPRSYTGQNLSEIHTLSCPPLVEL